jgi:Glycosyltransferase Family 4
LRIEPHLAVIDGASFVLPYDHGLVEALSQRGWCITIFASRTRYNDQFLNAMAALPGVEVRTFGVSRTVAPRWRGAMEYTRLWCEIWRRRREFDAINLQFSILWVVECCFVWLLRRKVVTTLHNAVPHGFTGRRHRSTAVLLRWSSRVVFVSAASQRDAVDRYGPLPHSTVLPHGVLPPAPGATPRPYGCNAAPQALVFWGNVSAYKGVDLIHALAHSKDWLAKGCGLEVHGAFEPGLAPLRQALVNAGVKVVDRFLGDAELQALFTRPVIFVLPYRRATQSGALYTLLHQGCRFICTDSGDLGDFMRQHDMANLLIRDHSAQAVVQAWDALLAEPEHWGARFQAAQQRCNWPAALANAEAAYGVPEFHT